MDVYNSLSPEYKRVATLVGVKENFIGMMLAKSSNFIHQESVIIELLQVKFTFLTQPSAYNDGETPTVLQSIGYDGFNQGKASSRRGC